MKIFKEEQRFTQTWLIIIVIIAAIGPLSFGIYGIIQQIILKHPFGDSPMSDTGLVIFTICMFFLSIFIFSFKLTTRIDENGIHYQFFPIHFSLKSIAWSAIKTVHVRKYDPITEYGGWGYKGGAFWNSSKGSAMNISGNIGIQLELKNGKKLLIGTQTETEAKRVIETYQNKFLNL